MFNNLRQTYVCKRCNSVSLQNDALSRSSTNSVRHLRKPTISQYVLPVVDYLPVHVRLS